MCDNGTDDHYTIVLGADIAQTTNYSFPDVSAEDEITLDLAGYTLTLDSENTYAISNGGVLNIVGDGIITNYDTNDGSELIGNSGTLNLISGSIISNSTSEKYDYRAAVNSFGGELNISDGFVIRAEKEKAVGVMIEDSVANFGSTIGKDAEQLEIVGDADGVIIIDGTVTFNNGRIIGNNKYGVLVANSNDYNDDEDNPVEVTVNYAEFSGKENDFYVGIDYRYSGEQEIGTTHFYPDKRDVKFTLADGLLDGVTAKGLVSIENSTHDWNININKSAFDVTVVSSTDDIKIYEVTKKDSSAVLDGDVIKGEYPYYAFVEDANNPWISVWDALDATGTYEYSDQYFAVLSPGLHANLRTMSYALALAGFENQADGYPYDDNLAANPKLRKLLNEIGFSDYESWDESSDKDGTTFGTSIAHKTITYKKKGGEQETKELIVVAPRNYNYMTEWLSNFNVGENGDHTGFANAASLVVSRLDQYIAEHDLSNYKIWMVGYSRGGAVVDLAARTINENIAKYDMSADDLYVYTFGAPKASATETNYSNIHDVKDGNDLLLGYIFPQLWGFYNTGSYEEIHEPDLEIATYAIDISELTDSTRVMSYLISNDGSTVNLGNRNAKEFVDEWLEFVTTNGLTREYFDTKVKTPLSKLMQAYQRRHIDEQSDFTSFISSTDSNNGLLAHVALNALAGIYSVPGDTIEEKLGNFALYQDIVKVLRGTATEADINEIANYLEEYIGVYADYGESCLVSEGEFLIIKETIPELIRVLGPFLVADAKYTIENMGEDDSLYYGATMVLNFYNLVAGHTPEVIMPTLKEFVDPEEPDEPDEPVEPVEPVEPIEPVEPVEPVEPDPVVPEQDEGQPRNPDTGMMTSERNGVFVGFSALASFAIAAGIIVIKKLRKV